MRRLYAGSDLHSNNNFLGRMDGLGKKVFKKKLSNDPRIVAAYFVMRDQVPFDPGKVFA